MSALSFLGVPYRAGGEDPARGFDCSGLVRQAVRIALGLDLPRRSDEMREAGHPVRPESLRAGDLLFFNTLGRPFSHVALYIGEGRFVHSPARGGKVRIESMRVGYWRARFNGAWRLDAAAGSPSTGRNPEVDNQHPARSDPDTQVHQRSTISADTASDDQQMRMYGN